MAYSVKETYFTLQGEGRYVGRPAVFCRFTGCNLWSGKEDDRASAVCTFCDTDFLGTSGPGGGRFENAESLANHISAFWPNQARISGFVVFTGGEPLLQLNEELIAQLHDRGFEVGVETNGTLKVPAGVDHLCVSPKKGAALVLTSGDELKLVFPQIGLNPKKFEELDFKEFFLQPMDGPLLQENTKRAIDYCKNNPLWRLSLQVHKILEIP